MTWGGHPEVPLHANSLPRDQPGPEGPQLTLGPWGPRARARFSLVEGFRPRDSEQPRGAGPLPFLLDLRVLLPLLRPQRLPLLRRGLVAVITQQEGPDLPPD